MKHPLTTTRGLAFAACLFAITTPNSLQGNSFVLTLEQSTDRKEWTPVEVTPEMLNADGRIVWPGVNAFFRMGITERPPPMVLIPAGTFTMGRTSGDTDSNAPPVNVYVSEFYMATHQVTWELWNEVRTWAMNRPVDPYTDIATGGGKAATHPVHSVNWWDVVKWCNARSERDGLTPVYTNGGNVMRTGTTAPTANWSANGYRLPTEAEWEKAARGGVSGQRFPWGDTISHANANFINNGGESYQTGTTDYHPTYNDGVSPRTSPVGSFAPNGYGLYDMAGNVREWNWDWYSASTYTEGISDPKGPASGSSRVLRGGSWNSVAIRCRSAHRFSNLPGNRSSDYGFRPARSSVP